MDGDAADRPSARGAGLRGRDHVHVVPSSGQARGEALGEPRRAVDVRWVGVHPDDDPQSSVGRPAAGGGRAGAGPVWAPECRSPADGRRGVVAGEDDDADHRGHRRDHRPGPGPRGAVAQHRCERHRHDGSTTVWHASDSSGGPDTRACWISQTPVTAATATPASRASTRGSSGATRPEPTWARAVRSSSETTPNATAPAVAHPGARNRPRLGSAAPASPATTRAASDTPTSSRRPGCGAPPLLRDASTTKETTPTRVMATPANTPPGGRARVRAKTSRTATGTASTPIGWTTARGASASAVTCSRAPAAVSVIPPSHTRDRTSERSRTALSRVSGAPPTTAPTARCWTTAAPPKATAPTTARTTAIAVPVIVPSAVVGASWSSVAR